jgi:hypothetical protein
MKFYNTLSIKLGDNPDSDSGDTTTYEQVSLPQLFS